MDKEIFSDFFFFGIICLNLGDVMEKIIFLDIDGVLNDNTVTGYLDRCVNSLKRIVDETNGKIVIISSLQGSGTINKRNRVINSLQEVGIFVDNFIDPNFIGKLEGLALSSRIIGIVDYLEKHRQVEYVILDDEYQTEYKLLSLNNYEIDMWTGLREEDVNKIIFIRPDFNILDKVNYKYRELGSYEQATNNLIRTLKKVIDKRVK